MMVAVYFVHTLIKKQNVIIVTNRTGLLINTLMNVTVSFSH